MPVSKANLSPEPEWLRSGVVQGDQKIGVDRKAGVIRGFVMAEKGPFKSQGRGEFDDQSLDEIVVEANRAYNGAGLKSNFTHPTESSDGLGKYLGRVKDARREGDKVRGDLHLNPTSFETPNGNLAKYVMDLAESDPGALSSSLVIVPTRIFRKDDKGRLLRDAEGNELPPIWRPKKLRGSDIVADGDAVHGSFLSALSADVGEEEAAAIIEGLPNRAVFQAYELLNAHFRDAPRPTVEARCRAFLEKFLALKYQEETEPPDEEKSGLDSQGKSCTMKSDDQTLRERRRRKLKLLALEFGL